MSGGHVCGRLVEHGDQGFELKPGDVGPATAPFHGLEKVEKVLPVFGQTAAESAVLDAAVERLDRAQQREQGFRVALQITGQTVQSVKQSVKPFLLGRGQHLGLGTGD